LWPLPFPRGGGGHGNYIHQAFLSDEHGDGLASEERHVRSIESFFPRFLRSLLGPFPGEQVDSPVPRDENDKQPNLLGFIRRPYPKNRTGGCSRVRVPRGAEPWVRFRRLASASGAVGSMVRSSSKRSSEVPGVHLWILISFAKSVTQLPQSELDQVYNQAMSRIRASRLTDAEFIYSPAQIAAACISLASPQIANTWMRSKGTDGSFIPSLCAAIQEGSEIPGVEMIREVDRRLKLCKNPEKVVGSSAYLAKKAEEERLAAERRTKKADEIRNASGDDPFGSELGTTLDDDD